MQNKKFLLAIALLSVILGYLLGCVNVVEYSIPVYRTIIVDPPRHLYNVWYRHTA